MGVIVPSYLVGCILVGSELHTRPMSLTSASENWNRQCPCDILGIQEGIVAGQASGTGLGGSQLWRP